MTEAARPVEAQYAASRRRLALVGVVWLMSGCVLVGCGGSPAEPTATTPARPSPTAPSPTPPPSEASSPPSAGSWSGSGPSFGADRVRWPGTLDGARQVLAKMPKTLGGKAGELSYTSGDRDDPARDAGVSYGSLGSVTVFEEYATDDTGSGKPGVMGASSLLSASFGLMYGCAKGTYHGTAPRPMYPHGGPGMSEASAETAVVVLVPDRRRRRRRQFLRLRGRVDQQEDGLAGGGERREDRQVADDGTA